MWTGSGTTTNLSGTRFWMRLVTFICWGHSILGEFVGFKSGHTENHALRSALIAQPEAWDIITFDGQERAPSAYAHLGGFEYAS